MKKYGGVTLNYEDKIMGCFSFICKECGEAVLSDSFAGQEVTLSLLKDGNVVQAMTGEYDSYGRCFIEGSQEPSVKHKLKLSYQWENPFPEVPPTENELYFVKEGEEPDYWGRVCSLMFSSDSRNGIAAVHTKCQVEGKVPTTKSEDDPNQGWGDEDELMGDCDPDLTY